ncbi:hypothetical protein CGLO_07689 [Colletotrichum gloeosporioides Cg-14]|uniref:Uncharacterized protein n=1 Tax=Colletotrichum gloeosporioides (strain Cg-14) TaxID=1237896 RepID=T0KIH4_COLGC|nr:hypothetical protein CGLO_07689 [Colletotrichum gloeosporioides Cg-14]
MQTTEYAPSAALNTLTCAASAPPTTLCNGVSAQPIIHDGIESVWGQRLVPMPTAYRCHVGNITKRRRQWPVRTWLAHSGSAAAAARPPVYLSTWNGPHWKSWI